MICASFLMVTFDFCRNFNLKTRATGLFMQFPESWLREFCNPPITTQQLADTLTMAGLEVEELRPVAPPFKCIVVGEIIAAEQHPNADRLRICQVGVGGDRILSVVCGAHNARVGIKVPCALVGAELPPGDDGQPFVIKVGKLRGVESQGMLCSARELKLSEDHTGLLELDFDAVPGQDIREHLLLDDTLFTLKLTPNLAHCLSLYGVAREVSALTGSPLTVLTFPSVAVTDTTELPVTVSAPDLCDFRDAWCEMSTRKLLLQPGWWTAWRAVGSAALQRWSIFLITSCLSWAVHRIFLIWTRFTVVLMCGGAGQAKCSSCSTDLRSRLTKKSG